MIDKKWIGHALPASEMTLDRSKAPSLHNSVEGAKTLFAAVKLWCFST